MWLLAELKTAMDGYRSALVFAKTTKPHSMGCATSPGSLASKVKFALSIRKSPLVLYTVSPSTRPLPFGFRYAPLRREWNVVPLRVR